LVQARSLEFAALFAFINAVISVLLFSSVLVK
jgi:hypothetical protein